MNKTDLRPRVFEALRRVPHTDFQGVNERLVSMGVDHHAVDPLNASEILWELLVQNILAPGNRVPGGGYQVGLPFFHVTEYGESCLEADAVLPHDPDGYLKRLQQQIAQSLDCIVLDYVRESLLTFLGGYYLSSTVMLGVASERCIDLLANAFTDGIKDENRKATLENKIKQAGRSTKRRFDTLRHELLALDLPLELNDALDIQLSGIFTLIRYSRNDTGHPTGQLIDRDIAYGNLTVFPQYCKRVYELIQYFNGSPL